MTTTIKTTTETKILLQAKAMIEKYGWTQEIYGDRGYGFCAVGALREVDREIGGNRALRLLALAMKKHHCTCGEHDDAYDENIVVEWNDTEGRTKEETLAAFDRAIALGMEVAP